MVPVRSHPGTFCLPGRHAPALGPGFWIRFTVHYNLCAGTVLGLGNEEQIKMLDEWQEQGLLGCFRYVLATREAGSSPVPTDQSPRPRAQTH